jgi:hypothetical protein
VATTAAARPTQCCTGRGWKEQLQLSSRQFGRRAQADGQAARKKVNTAASLTCTSSQCGRQRLPGCGLNTSAVSWNRPRVIAEMPMLRWVVNVETLVPVASLTALHRRVVGKGAYSKGGLKGQVQHYFVFSMMEVRCT